MRAPHGIEARAFWRILACSGYPECRNTKKIVKKADSVEVKQDIPLEESCPACGKNLAIKHGRFGAYTACGDYPNCKYIKLKTTGVRCPKSCGGEIVERKSKRGKVFYGCSNYPDCDFVVWNKPVGQPCPKCGAPYTAVKPPSVPERFVTAPTESAVSRNHGRKPDHRPESLCSNLGSTASTIFPTLSILTALILSSVSPAVCQGS